MWELLIGPRLQGPDRTRRATRAGRGVPSIEAHLAMVFHRFLAQQARRALPLTITVQGNVVEPWDPFARRAAPRSSTSRA